MNEMVASHQNIISQKDKQINDFQKQVDTLHKAESELTKQIEEQKAKNNVSENQFSNKLPNRILIHLLILILRWNFDD